MSCDLPRCRNCKEFVVWRSYGWAHVWSNAVCCVDRGGKGVYKLPDGRIAGASPEDSHPAKSSGGTHG